jgi:hypothetical protein
VRSFSASPAHGQEFNRDRKRSARHEEVDLVKAMQMFFKVPVEIRKVDGGFVASCFLVDAPQEGPNKHETLVALTNVVQEYVTSCCGDRAIDAMLHRHDLRLPEAGDELKTGHYIDVSILLKIPASTCS